MKCQRLHVLVCAACIISGCTNIPPLSADAEPQTPVASATQEGRITTLETTQLEAEQNFGARSAIGAVTGGLIGSQVGRGSTRSTVTGAAIGAAIGTVVGAYAQSAGERRNEQHVTVQLATGDVVTVTQPVDARLSAGMTVRVEGTGESTRVVPQ
jgi:outer membrane lipoprotein SlyB